MRKIILQAFIFCNFLFLSSCCMDCFDGPLVFSVQLTNSSGVDLLNPQVQGHDSLVMITDQHNGLVQAGHRPDTALSRRNTIYIYTEWFSSKSIDTTLSRFLQWRSGETDTLNMRIIQRGTRCCPMQTLQALSLNGHNYIDSVQNGGLPVVIRR